MIVLYDISLSEVNDSIRYKYYNLMDKIIIDNAQIVPLYTMIMCYVLLKKTLSGLASNPINMLNLKYVDKMLFKSLNLFIFN